MNGWSAADSVYGKKTRKIFCISGTEGYLNFQHPRAYIELKERFKLMATYNNKTIVLHELLGLDAEVINSNDKSQVGVRGKVIDETKNTLLIETDSGLRTVIKKISTFRFKKGSKSFVVNGEEINFRGYERIEKGLKFYKKRKL